MAISLVNAIVKSSFKMYNRQEKPVQYGIGIMSLSSSNDCVDCMEYFDYREMSPTLRKRVKRVSFNEIVRVRIVPRIYTSYVVKRRSFYTKEELRKFGAQVKQD